MPRHRQGSRPLGAGSAAASPALHHHAPSKEPRPASSLRGLGLGQLRSVKAACLPPTSFSVCLTNGRDFPGGPVVKNLPSTAGDVGLIPGWGTKIPYTMEQLSPCAATTEPSSHNQREAQGLQQRPSTAKIKKQTPRKRAVLVES